MLGTIRKAIATLVGTVLTWCTLVINNHSGDFPVGDISAIEWLGLATAIATAFAVYGITNDPTKLHPEDV